MRKYIKIYLKIFFVFILLMTVSNSVRTVYADTLSDNINQQLNNLDLSALENFFKSTIAFEGVGFTDYLIALLNGNYSFDYGTIFSYILRIFFTCLTDCLPTFITIIAISIFSAIISQVRNSFLTDSVAEVAFYVCLITIVAVLLSQIISIFNNAKIIIENIAILSEIMSPIILTLMVSVGGNVSASVYQPTVAFLSNGVINIVLYVVFPLIVMCTFFSISSNFNTSIKFTKFSDFINGIIKWVVGITATIFGTFLSIQGITSACYDGISLKATKYAITNSIPLVGGFIKDGFDLIIAGSILIKQAVGLSCVLGLFFILISPVLSIATFSLLLKLATAIIETVSDNRLSNCCVSITKSLSFVIAMLLIVGFMFFITVLLMIFSANAFI